MTALAATDKLFFERADAALDQAAAAAIVEQALRGSDDGELFLEYRESEHHQPGRRPHPHCRVRFTAWASACARSRARRPAMPMPAKSPKPRCAAPPPASRRSRPAIPGSSAEPPRATNARLYSDANPLRLMDFSARTALLAEIDAYARGKDPRVKQVMASISGEWQAVQIMRADGTRVADLRPLVRLNVSVVVEQDGRRETGSYGTGGRFAYDLVTEESSLAGRGR